MKKPYEIIKIDQYTKKIQTPNLLLMTRSFDVLGKIPDYADWNISLVGNGTDEISFTVNKYVNGNLCPVWDALVDLKIVDVTGFGRFEISVDYTDNTQTAKSVHGVSLETELAQIPLYEFHVNDEDAMTMEITDYNASDFDDHGNFIPTVFYNPKDEKHSLLHRILADKAPHWSIGDVTPYIAMDEESQPEPSDTFQRTYTADGTTIYDLLTGEIAEESNVVFIFDTIHRIINCYSLCDCIDQSTGEVFVSGIGEDTNILVSKRTLANEITISSNKDNVKNCFRVEGGDDVITNMIGAVNMNSTNYIYQFADFQYHDMPEELAEKLQKYQTGISSPEVQDEYYGENGIYTRLCQKYEDLAYYESVMMPDVEIKETSAEEQYNIMVAELTKMTVGISSPANYNNNLFVGISNNVEAMANILIDSRYDAEVIEGSTAYNSATGTWTGNIRITRAADDTDVYPKNETAAYKNRISVTVTGDELTFTRQKIEKALSKGSMLDIDFDVAEMTDTQIREYFNLYSLNRLQSFYDGYNSCLSILMAMPEDSPVRNDLYNKYFKRMSIVSDVKNQRQTQVDAIYAAIKGITEEQKEFQKKWDFQNYLEDAGKDFYKKFCAYRREDTYTNSNYISDGLSTADCLAKAKELLDTATKEAKKACVLQRTLSTSLNNLFALPEFEPFYEKFALFNYIRIRTEDEILKLRLIGVEFNGDSVENINVTFSEQIESVDGKTSDLQSIIQQAGSIATSFPSTALQAQKGEKAQNSVLEMYHTGLNAARTMLTNNDSNEVTITSAGIECKRMDDEGYYGDKQLRITGNMIAFTKDAWQNVELAIGETTFKNPITNESRTAYGIIAENIVGKFMASDTAYIGNESGSVLIDGDGIEITNGVIKSANYSKAAKTGSIIELTDGTFSFAGEKLKYENNALSVEGNITATKLTATTSGKIANFNISSNALYTDNATYGASGIYLGSNGLSLGSGFYVDANGNVTSSGKMSFANGNLTYNTANGLTVKGNIQANGGTFSGNITSTATISGGTISGSTINGGTIASDDIYLGNVLRMNVPIGFLPFYTNVLEIDATGGSDLWPIYSIVLGGGGERQTISNLEVKPHAIFDSGVSCSGSLFCNIIYANNMRSGSETIIISAANTPTGKAVSWEAMSDTPYVVATPKTSVPGTTVLGVGVSGVSKTGCTIWVTRTGTTQTGVDYIAIA